MLWLGVSYFLCPSNILWDVFFGAFFIEPTVEAAGSVTNPALQRPHCPQQRFDIVSYEAWLHCQPNERCLLECDPSLTPCRNLTFTMGSCLKRIVFHHGCAELAPQEQPTCRTVTWRRNQHTKKKNHDLDARGLSQNSHSL